MRNSKLTNEMFDECDFDFGVNEMMTGHELLSAMSTSPLVDAVFQTCPNVYCVRYLHQVEICSLEMSVHDWIFVREHKVAVVAQVSQMALVRHGARIGVYIWCRNCHAASMLLEDPDGMMRVPTGGAKQSPSMLVALSDVSVSTLSCAVRPDHLEFRYRF